MAIPSECYDASVPLSIEPFIIFVSSYGRVSLAWGGGGAYCLGVTVNLIYITVGMSTYAINVM